MLHNLKNVTSYLYQAPPVCNNSRVIFMMNPAVTTQFGCKKTCTDQQATLCSRKREGLKLLGPGSKPCLMSVTEQGSRGRWRGSETWTAAAPARLRDFYSPTQTSRWHRYNMWETETVSEALHERLFLLGPTVIKDRSSASPWRTRCAVCVGLFRVTLHCVVQTLVLLVVFLCADTEV